MKVEGKMPQTGPSTVNHQRPISRTSQPSTIQPLLCQFGACLLGKMAIFPSIKARFGKELALFGRMNPTSLKPFGLRAKTGAPQSNNSGSDRHFPAFHKFCSTVGTELSRDYVVDFTIFTIIGLISAWPILCCVVAIGHLLRVS